MTREEHAARLAAAQKAQRIDDTLQLVFVWIPLALLGAGCVIGIASGAELPPIGPEHAAVFLLYLIWASLTRLRMVLREMRLDALHREAGKQPAKTSNGAQWAATCPACGAQVAFDGRHHNAKCRACGQLVRMS